MTVLGTHPAKPLAAKRLPAARAAFAPTAALLLGALLLAACAGDEPLPPRTVVVRPLPPERPFPNLASVPARPDQPTPGEERADESAALAADRGRAAEADRAMRAAGPVPPPLPPESARPNLALLGPAAGLRRTAPPPAPTAAPGAAVTAPAAPVSPAPAPRESASGDSAGGAGTSRLPAPPPAVLVPPPPAPPAADQPRWQVSFAPGSSALDAAAATATDAAAAAWREGRAGRLVAVAAGTDAADPARLRAVAERLRAGGVPADAVATRRGGGTPGAVEIYLE